jgi:integrase
VRPISRAVLLILDDLQRTPGSIYVLPAARGGQGPFVSLDDALERIVSRAGLEGVSAHILRPSFASTAGDLGYSHPTIGATLGHAGHVALHPPSRCGAHRRGGSGGDANCRGVSSAETLSHKHIG